MKHLLCAIALGTLTVASAARPAAAYIDAIEIIHPEFFTQPMLWQIGRP
jgi:hypothetical protein